MSTATSTTTALVIGGRGFIGQHIVRHLSQLGAKVVIGTRGQRRRPHANERRIQLHSVDQRTFDELLRGIDVVINTVGILRQRPGESYEQVHHLAVAKLARACQRQQCRLIHVSALGLKNPVASRFLLSKLRGEQALKRSGADWAIVRPSLVDGEGGFGARWCRRVAHWPIHIAPANSQGKLSPIDVNDLGEAVARLALLESFAGRSEDREYELGGLDHWPMLDYLDALSPTKPIARLTIPSLLARLAAHACDLLHVTPFSFGHYELLKYDNIPARNRLGELLGRSPTRIGADTRPDQSTKNRGSIAVKTTL